MRVLVFLCIFILLNKFVFSRVQQFPDNLSFESLVTTTNVDSKSTNRTTDSLPSSPSLNSLDKLSTTSNNYVYYRQHFQTEQPIIETVEHCFFSTKFLNFCLHFRVLMHIILDRLRHRVFSHRHKVVQVKVMHRLQHHH